MQAGNTPKVQDYYSSINPPDPEELKLQLQDLVQQGTLEPEQAQAILLGESKMNDVNANPDTVKAQMDALSGLQDITSSGGETAVDKARLNQISQDEDMKSRGAREAILQNAQARGAGGSGLEMLNQLTNAQDSATRQSTRDLDVNAQAQQHALEALTQQGNLAGNIQGQQFNQAAQKAGAQDAIAKFNAQNQQQVGMTNTAANNAAQTANLAEKQKVADTNVGTQNAQQQYNKSLPQQQFQNQLQKAGGQTGVSGTNAAIQQKANEADQGFLGGLIKTGGGIAAAVSDERAKKDIKPFDASEFLDSLTPSKFKYKDKKNGAGEHVGVMAQDMEKTDVGAHAVHDTPDGKVIDYGQAAPAIMASVASLHARMKKLEKGGKK